MKKSDQKCLRIETSMRYNALNGEKFPNKTVRAGARNTYTNLTQPTDTAADWAGIHYTNPYVFALVGFHRGFLILLSRTEGQNAPPRVGGNMLEITHPPIIARSHVVEVLANLRDEWEHAAKGPSLVDVDGSVGLILADLVSGFDLTPSEQKQVLGADLANELQDVLITLPGDNGRH